MGPEPLVSVIVPAFNAEATVAETLDSVLGQTHRALEVLVVDDGSRDRTPAIVEAYAARDGRVRLVRQANAGVAAARNRGIAEAAGDLVAPVDADDLWRPTKIARQVEALAARPAAALAYTWYAVIDETGAVRSLNHTPRAEGDVTADLCLGNLVGNGSSPLMRRSAVLACGGYDASLRARRAQGCEDYKLYFQIARAHEYALVPEHLTGYRITRGNMSSDVLQMWRSYTLVVDEMRPAFPQHARLFDEGRSHFLSYFLHRALDGRQAGAAARLLSEFARHDPAACRQSLSLYARGKARRLTGRRRIPSGAFLAA